MPIGKREIELARRRIGEVVQNTALEYSRNCSRRVGTSVFLKYENEQITGSFKIRGALNKMYSLSEEEKKRGVVASSAGNHAQGVAYSATYVGTKAHIVMPESSSLVKAEATRNYGAEVIFKGSIYDESYAHAKELEKEQGFVFVHPYQDEHVIAGQGTIGLEIIEQLPEVDSVVVAIGGGGLISGVATAIKAKRPSCKIYGAVAENAPAMYSLYKKEPVPAGLTFSSIADGIAVKAPSQFMFDNYISKLVDDIIPVSENEIAEAMVFLLERTKTVVEGAGAIGLAAATKAKDKWDLGQKCCILLCGGNVDLNLMAKIIDHGLSEYGRIARLSAVVEDKPGTLQALTDIIAKEGANILEVEHDRLSSNLAIRETAISFLLETRNQDHIGRIQKAMESTGARVMDNA